MSEFKKLLESVRAGKKLQEAESIGNDPLKEFTSDQLSLVDKIVNEVSKITGLDLSPVSKSSTSIYYKVIGKKVRDVGPGGVGYEFPNPEGSKLFGSAMYGLLDRYFSEKIFSHRGSYQVFYDSNTGLFVENKNIIANFRYAGFWLDFYSDYRAVYSFTDKDKREFISSHNSSSKSDQMESNNTAPDNTAPDFVIENGSLIEYNGKESIVVIPDSVTSIGKGAFNRCSGLKSITIPDSVKSIGGYAFFRCTGLSSIEIPDSVSSIGDGAFGTCYGLKSVTIGSSVTYLGWGAFKNCYGLRSITIPSSVTSINPETFKYCDNLTSIDIPNSVTNIGEDAFNGCTKLKNIMYKGTIAEWKDISKWYGWKEEVPKSCKIHCTDGDI